MALEPSLRLQPPQETSLNTPAESLRKSGLLDLLDHDPRPTFILDATDAHNSGSEIRPNYHNDALVSAGLGGLWDVETGNKDAEMLNGENPAVSPSQFRDWAIDRNSASRNPYSYCDYSWRKCLIANQWIVISGSPAEALYALEERKTNRNGLSKKSSRSNFTTFDWTDDPPPVKLSAHVTWARSIDWANTPLGPMKAWSPQLRCNAILIMQDIRPAVGFYGPELIMIYNEAYIELLGGLHPCMGRSAREVLVAVWDDHFEPCIQRNLAGEVVENSNTEIPLIRNGYVEETYFSTRFIPIFNSEGVTIGHYEPVVETVSTRQSCFLAHFVLGDSTSLQIIARACLSVVPDAKWH